MKLRDIITDLMTIIGNGVESEKYQEIKAKLNELVPYAEYEEEVVMWDLATLLKIANEGIWFYNGSYVIGRSGEELKIDLVDQSFQYIELNDYDEDCDLWYKETFPFEDLGKTYFLTKEEADKFASEHRGIRGIPKYDAR